MLQVQLAQRDPLVLRALLALKARLVHKAFKVLQERLDQQDQLDNKVLLALKERQEFKA